MSLFIPFLPNKITSFMSTKMKTRAQKSQMFCNPVSPVVLWKNLAMYHARF